MTDHRTDDLSALAIEELDAACALSWAEMKRIAPWGDTYGGLTAGGLEVEVERRDIWAHQPEGAIAIEVEVRLPGTRHGAEARAVVEPDR